MSKTVEIPDQESFKLNEVCKLANVQPYMLRFWGTEFEQLEAKKSGTGQRSYTREQVELILEIRRLLFDEGLTIAGARKKVDAMMEAGGPAAVKAKTGAKAPKKPATQSAKDEPPAEEPPSESEEDGAAGAAEEPSEAEVVAAAAIVDDVAQQRVEPLTSALRDVRGQIAEILTELRGS